MTISRHPGALLAAGCLYACLLSAGETARCAGLPTYDDFRRVDRVRRLTGQLQTAELVVLGQIDGVRLLAAVRAHPDDWQVEWGAAELANDWRQKRGLYEETINRSGTNLAVATRFACAAALARDDQTAVAWLRYLQNKESDNLAPWLAELWLRQAHPPPAPELFAGRPVTPQPPSWCVRFRDYGAAAGQARIRTLEAAGYSPYTARRLGYLPDPTTVQMARDLANQLPADEPTRKVLLSVARSMQGGATFLLRELAGQSLESMLLSTRTDAINSPEVRTRTRELDQRRQELRQLLATTEREAIDFATEAEMVRYFDDLLAGGEVAAMKRLLTAVTTQMQR